MKYLLLLLISFPVFAGPFDLSEEELNPEAEDVLIKKREKYLRDESMIYDFNTDLGIKDQRQYTGSDRNRFSVSGLINANYEQIADVFGGDVTYMRRSTRYNQIWWGGQFFTQKVTFDAVTQNRSNGDATSGEAAYQRPGSTKDTVMAGGLGVGYRFKLLLDFFPTEDVFEQIDVFANYVMFDETYVKKKYQGYGLTANYGIHKRSSTSFFYGGKLSYNIASVTREAIADEKKSDRSLALGWLALGFEMGFFF